MKQKIYRKAIISLCLTLSFVGAILVILPYRQPLSEISTIMNQEKDLKKLLFQIDPSLKHLQDPLEIAHRLLPILCHLCIDCHSTQDENITKKDHNALNAQNYYRQCIRKQEGMLCAGRNTFFTKTLNELFGIEAFTINMGIPNTRATHLTTIIPIKRSNHYQYYLFDAYFGCHFVGNNGAFIDLASIFQGKPFHLKLLNYPQVYGKGPTVEIIQNLEREIPASQGKKVKDYPIENCSWQETLPLGYLVFGEVLNLPIPSEEMREDFFRLLKEQNIRGAMLEQSINAQR